LVSKFRYGHFILFLFAGNIHAQSLILQYDTYYNGNSYQNILYFNDSLSIWEDMPGMDDEAGEHLVKNFTKNSVIYTDHVFQKIFLVSDSLHPMQWEWTPFTKDILAYPCKSARTIFRGREYKAFYTTLLPSHIGPWKFGGLPGAVLEVTSSDASYHFKVTKITEADSILSPRYQMQEEEAIQWPEYCFRFIKAVDQYARYLQTANDLPGGKINMKIDRPEIIYPRVQNGAGIDTE
jgi:GLPGLI family protein